MSWADERYGTTEPVEVDGVDDVEQPDAGPAGLELWPAPADPMAVARAVIPMWTHGDVVALRFWRAGWMTWLPTGQWIEFERTAVAARLYARLEHAFYAGKKEIEEWRPNRHKVGDLLDALGAITFLPETVDPPTWLDGTEGPPPGEVVACTNGLLHVTSRELYGHDPRFFTRVAVPFAYQPDSPDPERWLSFLDDLWPGDSEAVAALQEWFGYVISGRVDLHKILLLVGPIRSGKGTIARVLTALVGKPNVAGPTLASLGTNFGMSPLLAKTLAVVSDARLGAGSDTVVERLLSISGEDAITVDRKYREPWTGHLGTRFLIISNELPNFGDASGAIASRFVVLETRQSWFGRENTRLTDELHAELPGILRWALDGLDRLTKTDRFTAVTSSADAIAALADMVSPIGAFVRECCLVGPAFEVPVRQLYEAWKDWCARNGHYHTGTLQTFGRDLRAVIPGLKVAQHRAGEQRQRWFAGLGLAARDEAAL
jgi:putative DNA primase/helicase